MPFMHGTGQDSLKRNTVEHIEEMRPDMNAWSRAFHAFKYLIYLHTGIFSYFFDWFTRASCCYNVDWCKLDDISQVYVGSQGREVHGVPTGPSQTLPQKISFQITKDYLYAVTGTMCEEFLSCLHQWHRTLILLVPIFGENECMISNHAIASCCASTCRRP